MARCRSHPESLIVGALIGAGVACMLMPESRRVVRNNVRRWIRELLADEDEFEGIENEAGATEGGLAATRAWPS